MTQTLSLVGQIADFRAVWTNETQQTIKLLECLTDASLGAEAWGGGRSIGRVTWHLAQSIPEMLNRMGLHVDGPHETEPVPTSAAAILDGYRRAATSSIAELASWNDADLATEGDMYGERWTRGFALQVLVFHEIHHRGQLTVLMRAAGLVIPGIYGPAMQEWAQWNMQPPAI